MGHVLTPANPATIFPEARAVRRLFSFASRFRRRTPRPAFGAPALRDILEPRDLKRPWIDHPSLGPFWPCGCCQSSAPSSPSSGSVQARIKTACCCVGAPAVCNTFPTTIHLTINLKFVQGSCSPTRVCPNYSDVVPLTWQHTGLFCGGPAAIDCWQGQWTHAFSGGSVTFGATFYCNTGGSSANGFAFEFVGNPPIGPWNCINGFVSSCWPCTQAGNLQAVGWLTAQCSPLLGIPNLQNADGSNEFEITE